VRILIVEDDPDGGEILRELFASEGFDVAWATTGERAIELSRAGPFEAAPRSTRSCSARPTASS
jgi:DNA-binding response OmpR family regulator